MVRDYIFERLKNVEEIKAICAAVDNEIQRIRAYISTVYNNSFVMYSDENGCTRYEKMLDLVCYDTDSLEDRHLRILAAFNGDLPYTKISLKQKLYALCGEENVFIEYFHDEHRLKVLLGLPSKQQYNAVILLIKRMRPCNMILDYGLKYNQHSILQGYTHAQLEKYTHEELRNEVLENGSND